MKKFQVTVEFLGNIENLRKQISQASSSIAQMGSATGNTQIQKQFDQLTRSVQNLQTKAQQPIGSQAEFNKLASELSRAEQGYDNLILTIGRLRNLSNSKKMELLDPGEIKRINDAKQALSNYEAQTKKAAKTSQELAAAQEKVSKASGDMGAAEQQIKSLDISLGKATKKYEALHQAARNLATAQSKVKELSDDQGNKKEKVSQQDWDSAVSKLKLAQAEANKLKGDYDDINKAVSAAKSKMDSLGKTRLNQVGELGRAKALLKEATQEAGRLETALKTTNAKELETAFETLKRKAAELNVKVDDLDNVNSIEVLKNRLKDLEVNGIEKADKKIEKMAQTLKGSLGPALSQTRQGLRDTTEQYRAFHVQAKEVEGLKHQLSYFFSLTNSVYLLRSALRSAFTTVKELDAVMTETAVVTNFSVGDMWEALPRYAEEASKLGASIKDMYAATTLYYQQGLETEAAMALGTETMKMARIANMEAADATQAMTAALRGFNMELNETSAIRVNDVYSQLAAITAADTEQIATAMSKTASIAASANMEFETTAALLAQIIETTQEAPETAGTALKTIIARFSEVKKLQNKGETTGEDEEGEVIDVNKIDAALKSVGISMKDFFAGTEGLDSVLMRLAEKWDTLDFTTQRYIATTAAGSRQQSRFIAMMSDYSRTTELVTAANNSAGASQRQFDKTMESLTSKLGKLKTAWDQFAMGIADDALIKLGIDLLRELLEGVNKLTGKLPGLVKSFANLALVFGALRTGRALLTNVLNGISGAIGKGVINAATEAKIIKQAAETGVKAGAAATKGTAAAINAKTSQAAILRSYQNMLFKIQTKIKPIKIIAPDTTALRAFGQAQKNYRTQLQGLRTEIWRLEQAGKGETEQCKKLIAQKQALELQSKRLAASYTLQGAGMETLTKEQQALLAAKMMEGEIDSATLSLMGPKLAARYAEVGAEGLEKEELERLNWAKTTENNLRKGGLVAFFTEIGLRGTNATATKLEAGETWALVRAKIAEAGGIWGLVKAKIAEAGARIKANSAMLTGIGITAIYVATIALLVAGIVKMVQAWKSASKAGRLAEINEQLEQLSQNAEEAKNQMESLADSENELKDMSKTLSDLNKGTLEWKQQLVKTNQAVLELINTYPELAEYVTRGAHGELTISEEGWDAANAAATSRYNQAVQAQTGLQTQKTAIEQEYNFEEAQSDWMQKRMNYEEFRTSKEGRGAMAMTGAGLVGLGGAITGGLVAGASAGSIAPGVGTLIGAAIGTVVGLITGLVTSYIGKSEEALQMEATGGLTEKEYTSFAAAAAERGLSYNNEEGLKALYEQMGFTANWNDVYASIKKLGANFDSLSTQALALESAQEAYVSAFASNAAANDVYLDDSEYSEQAIEGATGVYSDLDERIAAQADEIGKIGDEEKQKYANLTGQTIDQVNSQLEDKSLSEDTIRTVIATNQVNQEMVASMKKTVMALTALANETKYAEKGISSLVNALTTEGRKLTQLDMQQIMEDLGVKTVEDLNKLTQEDVDAYLRETWGIQGGTDELGIDYTTLVNNWAISQEAFTTTLGQFANMLGTEAGLESSAFTFDDNLSREALSGLSENMLNVVTASGTEGVSKMLLSIQSMIQNLTDPKDVEQFMSALNSVDWSDKNSIKNFSDMLEGMDITFRDGAMAIDDFETQMINLAGAIAKVDMEKITSGLKTVEGLEADLGERTENDRVFTAEQVVEYLTVDPNLKDQFYQTSSETYVFMGDSLTILQAALDANRQALIDNTDALTERARAEAIEGLRGQSFELTTRYTYFDEEAAQEAANKENERRQDAANREAAMDEGAAMTQYSDDPNAAGLGALVGLITWGVEQLFGGSSENASYDAVSASDYAGEYTTTETGSTTTDDIIAAIVNGEITIYDPETQKEGELGAGTYLDRQTAELIATTLGLDAAGISALDNDQLLARLQEVISGTRTVEEINAILDGIAQIEGATTDATYMVQDMNQFAPGLGRPDDPRGGPVHYEDPEPLTNHVTNQSLSAEASKEAADALRAQALQAGVNIATIEEFDKALKANNGILDANTAAILSNAIADKKTVAQLKKTVTAVTEITDKYEDLADVTNEDIQNIGTALGLEDMEVGSENFKFVQDNLDLINKALHGDIEAMNQFTALLAQQMGVEIDATTGFVDLSDIVNATGEVEQQAIAAMNALIEAGAFEIETVKVKESGYYDVPIQNAQGLITGFKKQYYEAGQVYQVVKPVEAPNVAQATGNYSGRYSGGGGGGGSSQEWKNPYDEFYNTVEKINEELRKREKLELRYQRLLDRNAATAAEIQKLTREQLASLDVERSDREGLLRNRQRQMGEIESEYSDVGEYAWYNEETGQIEIDWAKLEALDGSTDEELTARVEEYISKLEEQQDLIEEEEEAIEEINDAVWAIFEQGKEEYFDLEDQIKEAIIADRQREIDKLSEINDSITDSSSRLLDSMQEQIDEYRQNRDNQKAEEEITEKQRRLAYLQQDTSGANALEILQLQEEIDEAQESHTDSLIDQKITELQQQNDKAAEQRQQQIEIMQAQLDQYSESEEIWEEVNQLMEEGLDPENGLVRGSRLEELLKDEAGFSGMSKLRKMEWLNELNKNVALALAWLEGGGAMQHLIGQGNEVTFTNKDGDVVTGTVNENGDVEVRDANGNIIGIYSGEDFVVNSDGTITSREGATDAEQNIETEEEEEEDQDQGGGTPSWPSNLTKPSNLSETVTWGSSKSAVKSVQTALKLLNYNPGTIDGIYGPKTQSAIKQFQRDAKTKGWNPNIGNADGIVGPRTKQAFRAVQYKTGGLADFTGPAWLDGTKSKPEYILNADQTRAFFNLVDVLSSLRAQPSGNSTENNGDNTYDIDINVETMSSDYDVEQLAEKIKNMINADARYRNNNAVNLMR